MKRGVVYIVVNKRKDNSDGATIRTQYDPAVISAKSVKEHMSWLDITLYTNLKMDKFDDCFDNVVRVDDLETHHIMWQKKWEYMAMSPYDITLHMDADTYMCDDCYEIFKLMDHFDMSIPMSPHYYSRKIGVPESFPELAGGVILWKKNDKTKKFIHDMIEALKNRKRYYSDEPYLRWVLYTSDVRFSVLPMEYNCVLTHPGYLYGKIKIAHGRIDLVENAKIMNQDPGKKIFSGETLYLMDSAQKFLTVVKEIKYGHSKYTKGPKGQRIPEGETF